MPYASNSELPKAARDAYSDNCQSVFRHTWNSEYADHGDESRAFATAHAAAKRCQGGKKAMTLPLTTFNLFAPTLKTSKSPDGKLRLEGVASSTIKDRHGDQLSIKALRKMEQSAIGLTIFMNHSYDVPKDVFGTVEKVRLSKGEIKDAVTGEPIYDLRFGIRVADSNPEAKKTWELIDTDAVKLGLSIGAMVPEGGAAFDSKTGTYRVDDVDLIETSVVSIPANPRAWVDYVVKALSGSMPERLSESRRKKLASEIGTELPEEDEPEIIPTEPVGEVIEEGVEKKGLEVPEGATGFLTQDVDIGVLMLEALSDGIEEEHFETGGVETLVKESWSSAYVNALPNSAFACPGSRKYPHHSKSGAVDMAHLRAALSRVGDASNDQCGKAHLEAHAKKLGMGDREEKAFGDAERLLIAAMDESFDLEKDGSGQHPHAHIHEHEHEHGYGDSLTKHNHEHAHVHSHEHADDHEHASDQTDWQHNHQHDGSYEEDHAHEGTAEEKTEKDLEPDITKSTVTVWESDGGVIEVNTGRAKPKADGDPAQAESKTKSGIAGATEPQDESVLKVATDSLASATGTIKALHGQIKALRVENVELIEQRDAALEVTAKAMENTQQLLERLSAMPMGRKTQVSEFVKDFADLSAIYDEDVRRLLIKKG